MAAVVSGYLLPASSTVAQVEAKPFPSFRTTDRLNVDVANGLPFWVVPDVSIGPEDGGFTHSVSSLDASFFIPQDSMWGGAAAGASDSCGGVQPWLIVYEQAGECFDFQNGVFTSIEGKGSTLVRGPNLELIYTIRDGTRITLGPDANVGRYVMAITEIRRPNGLTTTYYYTPSSQPVGSRHRIHSVSNNNGYRLYYRYQTNDPTNPLWHQQVGVTAYNAAFVACDPAATCAIPSGWPASQYSQQMSGAENITLITDAGGQTTRFTVELAPFPSMGRFNRVKLPTSSVDNIDYTYCPHAPNCYVAIPDPPYPPIVTTIYDLVVSATMNGETWNYGMTSAGPFSLSRESIGPTGNNVTVLQTTSGQMQWLNQSDGTYHFSGFPYNRLSYVIWRGGNTTGWAYDSRGNVTQTIYTTTPTAPSSTLTETSIYPPSCINALTCNRPVSISDANGNITLYEYDLTHGGVTRKTGPSINGIALETRYSYVQRQARFLDASGAVVAGTAIWVLDRESFCRVGAASGNGCANPADEVVTLYDYGPTAGINNLLLRGVVRDANGAALRSCFSYDRFGNRVSETTPNANLAGCP